MVKKVRGERRGGTPKPPRRIPKTTSFGGFWRRKSRTGAGIFRWILHEMLTALRLSRIIPERWIFWVGGIHPLPKTPSAPTSLLFFFSFLLVLYWF